MCIRDRYERQKYGPDFTAYKSDPSRDITSFDSYYSGPGKYPNNTVINPTTLAQGNTAAAKVPAATTPDGGGFVPQKVYKDKNGNTATYLGNGKWQ